MELVHLLQVTIYESDTYRKPSGWKSFAGEPRVQEK